jgi:hypothetical protein
MRARKSVVVGSVLGMLMSWQAFAADNLDLVQKKCPTSMEAYYTLNNAELQAKLANMPELRAITQLHHNFIESFLFEYEKFPLNLRKEMTKAGGTINLLEGTGVAMDPTWTGDYLTKDGRDWRKVPGAGGSFFSMPRIPTRIVINNIYNHTPDGGHGSINLILHEHGHSMDRLYKDQVLSLSPSWLKIVTKPDVENVIRTMFGMYELTDKKEGFAELFAYYHACEATKTHLEQVAPTVADFFANLTSVKKFSRGGYQAEEQEERKGIAHYNYNTPSSNYYNQPAYEQQPRPRRRINLRKIFSDIGDAVDGVFNPEN